MKKYLHLIFLLLLIVSGPLMAQLDNPNLFIKFENIEENTDPEGESEFPPIQIPSLSDWNEPVVNTKYDNLGLEEPQSVSISQEDGFEENIHNNAPKYFTKDKEAQGQEFAKNQYLGDIKTNAAFVNVVYRDHEYVDGDRIRVFINEDVVQSNITLSGSFKGFDLPLQVGFNKIDFQALNQGTSGPNTAELHIYDDKGNLLSAKQWNLNTGFKATFIVVKE